MLRPREMLAYARAAPQWVGTEGTTRPAHQAPPAVGMPGARRVLTRPAQARWWPGPGPVRGLHLWV